MLKVKEAKKPNRSLPQDPRVLAMVKARAKQLRRDRPGLFLVPNVGQSRFLEHYRHLPFPKDGIFMGGNGAGKTVQGAKLTGMLIWGHGLSSVPAGVHPGYDGDSDYAICRVFRERSAKENRPIYGRIVATAASLKGNGAMMQRIKSFWPRGLWEGQKLGATYVSQFICWDREEDVGDEAKAIAVVDVKTIDQEPLAHAGPDMDFIWFDEPSTKDVYAENVGRCRGNEMAIRIHTLTPLELAGWLIDDLVVGADGVKTVVEYASLWDNCKNWHPEAKFWSGGEVGSGKVMTRGNLQREAIEDMIAKWKKQSPATMEARLYGKPTHLMGSVYKFWSPAIHFHDGIRLPDDWEEYPVWCVMDPHHARAPAVGWFVRTPQHDYALGEYPTIDYTRMEGDLKTIQDYSEMIQELEFKAGIADRVTFRYADPNSMKFRYATRTEDAQDGLTLQDLFRNAGLDFLLAIDNMTAGHEAVSMALSYDSDKPVGMGNLPRFQCLRQNMVCGGEMVNIPNSISRYAFKAKPLESNQQGINLKTIVSQEYKDFADVVRYFCRMAQDVPVEKFKEMVSDYDRVVMARAKIKALAGQRRRR